MKTKLLFPAFLLLGMSGWGQHAEQEKSSFPSTIIKMDFTQKVESKKEVNLVHSPEGMKSMNKESEAEFFFSTYRDYQRRRIACLLPVGHGSR